MKIQYLTTAIDYINGKPHLGHAYEKIGADVYHRYLILKGADPFLLVGTDEHSLNVWHKAEEAGFTNPQEYCDLMAENFRALYDTLGVGYDRFIRTTDQDHRETVQKVVNILWEKGYVKKGVYAGYYCGSCEAFLDAADLQDGKCPVHPYREPVWVEEENYFFTLSAFQTRLEAYYADHPGFIQPETRRNELINRLREGLKDISISRATVKWGIPFPPHPGHVVYVWFDALINYLTGASYLYDRERFSQLWPPAVQVIGKDIIWFHGIIWPAILMALDLPLPKTIYAHGHILSRGVKLSKSAGVTVDPVTLIERFGIDAVRYYLVKAAAWGYDGNFSHENLILTYNNDLANDYGNLLSRTTAMIDKYLQGFIPSPGEETGEDADFSAYVRERVERYVLHMDSLDYAGGLAEVGAITARANKYVDTRAPWALAKDSANRGQLATTLYYITEALRLSTLLYAPFIPHTPAKIWKQLGLAGVEDKEMTRPVWGYDYQGKKVERGEPVFPRIEVDRKNHS